MPRLNTESRLNDEWALTCFVFHVKTLRRSAEMLKARKACTQHEGSRQLPEPASFWANQITQTLTIAITANAKGTLALTASMRAGPVGLLAVDGSGASTPANGAAQRCGAHLVIARL